MPVHSGVVGPARSLQRPDATMPTTLDASDAANASVYRVRPSSSTATVGMAVATASASNAPRNTNATMPNSTVRCVPGESAPASAGSAAGAPTSAVPTSPVQASNVPASSAPGAGSRTPVRRRRCGVRRHTRTTFPVVARASSSRWARAASARGIWCVTTRHVPSAASASARSCSVDRSPQGRARGPTAHRTSGVPPAAPISRPGGRRHRPGSVPRCPAVEDEATGRCDEARGVGARVAADAVEEHGRALRGVLPDGGPRLVEPGVRPVVDGGESILLRLPGERPDERDLLRPAGERDDARPRRERALDEQRAEPAGRGRDDDGVRRGQLRQVEDADGGPPGADHGERVRRGDVVGDAVQRLDGHDGEARVPAAVARGAEVGRDPSPAPRGVDARPDDVHHPGDLAPGDRREGGERKGPPVASPRRRVVSSRWTPCARTATRTWPGPGTGSGTWSSTRFSGGPNACRRMASTGAPSGSGSCWAVVLAGRAGRSCWAVVPGDAVGLRANGFAGAVARRRGHAARRSRPASLEPQHLFRSSARADGRTALSAASRRDPSAWRNRRARRRPVPERRAHRRPARGAQRRRRVRAALLRARGAHHEPPDARQPAALHARDAAAGRVRARVAARGHPLARIRAALATLPGDRTPTAKDWHRLSAGWHADLDARIEQLTRLRDHLTDCIGCGCLSLRRCVLVNPHDALADEGPGPRTLLVEGIED